MNSFTPVTGFELGQIQKDLLELRRKIGGLVAEAKQGVMYKVKSAKDLHIKLRAAGDELKMPLCGAIVNQFVHNLDPIAGFNRKGEPQTTFIAHVVSTVRFMSADGSFVDFVGSGHGSGTDDKAGGKASTYSWKDAIIKGLCLPDEEMEDTDDAPGTLPAPPSLKMVLDSIKSSMNLNELEEAKLLASMVTWNTDDQALIKTNYIKRKAALAGSN
jgi:hypothetical protein